MDELGQAAATWTRPTGAWRLWALAHDRLTDSLRLPLPVVTNPVDLGRGNTESGWPMSMHGGGRGGFNPTMMPGGSRWRGRLRGPALAPPPRAGAEPEEVARQEPPMRFRRVVVTRSGGPDVLRLREEALPEPGPGEVRVRILAAGVSYADLLMREGVHFEAPRTPFTPGWDLAGVVHKPGAGVSRLKPGQLVTAMTVTGGYAQFINLPQEELISVPAGLDPAEVVCLVFNYVTAYQMMHRSAGVRPGERVLVHGAAGGIGTALLQLGGLAGLDMYGTALGATQEVVSRLGATPMDYTRVDFVKQLHRLTGDGVDVVFDGIGGGHLWSSLRALRPGGTVVAYGFTASLRGGRLTKGRRRRFRGLASIGLVMVAARLTPGGRRLRTYSIQRLKRRRPEWFRADLATLLELLRLGKLEPIIAARLPLEEVARAHEMLGRGGVVGKIVLLPGS